MQQVRLEGGELQANDAARVEMPLATCHLKARI